MHTTVNPNDIWQAKVQQLLYRELLQAMARPGTIRDLGKFLNGAPAWTGILATLIDAAITFSNPDEILDKTNLALLRTSVVAPERAGYLLLEGRKAPAFSPALGTLESPEFGATLIIRVCKIGDGEQLISCQGPGIKKRHDLKLSGLHRRWWEKRAFWNRSFPLGVDFLLVDEDHCTAFPRTTKVSY